ncbi:MAG: Multi antimicrobial extrusion protein [Myxococcaceae bacterium]|nr:Multi antimicrobial extrusion protein [Myxococcaceae bacterium]
MTGPKGPPRLWSIVREALRGSHVELTEISIPRAVAALAIPMVLEMSMESLFAVVDIFYVSKLGSDAVATVGLTEALLSLMYALAMGSGAAATAVISRRSGEKDADGAASAAVHVIFEAVVVALVLGAVGAALSPRLLSAMGAAPSVVESGSGYTAIMLGGSVTIFLLFVVNAVFRGAGDAAIAMRSLWLANLLNIVLAPCFIFGVGPIPRMGVAGAAVATTLSRATGVAYQLVTLARGRGRLVLLRKHFVFRARLMTELLRLGATASLQTLVETASWLGLVRIVASFGSTALAGYTIAMRVAIFALLPSWGMANAAATLVGQNLGAGHPERASKSVSTIALYNLVFLGGVSALFALFPGWIVEVFTHDAGVLVFGTEALRIVALGFLCFGYGMIVVQAFNGAGDPTTPMLLNIVCFWVVKIPIAYVLARPLGLGPRGVFLAITLGYSLQAITGGILFRRGRWKKIKLA